MSGFRALCSPRLYTLPRTPLHPTPILQRFISASPLLDDQIQDDNFQKGKKPLLDLFKEAVGLRKKPESESEGEDTELKKKLRELEREVRRLKSITVTESETPKKKELKKDGVLELSSNAVTESETPKKKKSKELKKDGVLELSSNAMTESETPKKKKSKELKKDGVLEEQTNPKTNSLSSLFLNGKTRDGKRRESGSLEKKKETEEEEEPAVSKSGSLEKKKKKKKETKEEDEPAVFKDLSEDMLLFLNHLHRKGYFKNANFLPRSGSIDGAFDDKYSRCFVKFAAEKFGRDNQEIAKWLSGSDLKKVALFGCPSLSRRSIFAAKRLRTFFRIQEELVCSKCVLKQSCKFVNQSVWKGDTKSLNLSVTMRLLTLYAMGSTHPQLVLSDEVKASVNRLLKDVLRLSDTVA